MTQPQKFKIQDGTRFQRLLAVSVRREGKWRGFSSPAPRNVLRFGAEVCGALIIFALVVLAMIVL